MSDADATAIIVIGGDPPDRRALARLPVPHRVIAADGGLDHAAALGLTVDAVVGDLDSATPDGLARARVAGAVVEQHPADKDATDTELALQRAVTSGATTVVVLAGGGDRLDHWLGALIALGAPELAAVESVQAWFGPARVDVLHGPKHISLDAPVGATVSLLALAGPCAGVTTTGLRWALHDAELPAASSRGVSNEVVETPACVEVRLGPLWVVRPDALEVTA
jgi:thiamine pyrophosphokinase